LGDVDKGQIGRGGEEGQPERKKRDTPRLFYASVRKSLKGNKLAFVVGGRR
jgi:hypothetical protein